jgi:hypothetical protein
MYAIVNVDVANGTKPTFIAGCHEIRAIDSGGANRLTLRVYHNHGTAPSGAITGTINILSTILVGNYSSTCPLNTLSNIGIIANDAINGIAVSSNTGSILNMSKVGISHGYAGINCINGAFINADSTCACSASQQFNIQVVGGSCVFAGISNGAHNGITAQSRAQINANTSFSTGCSTANYVSSGVSSIDAYLAKSTGSLSYGMLAWMNGNIDANTSTSSDNTTADHYAGAGGLIDVAGATYSVLYPTPVNTYLASANLNGVGICSSFQP